MVDKTQFQKALQGYDNNPTPVQCSTCENYEIGMRRGETPFVMPRWGETPKKKDRRCRIGGFAVKKKGVCNLYIPVEE